MTRDQWHAAYREARKSAGYILRFSRRIKHAGLLADYTTVDACPGFTFDRLSRDCLRYGRRYLGKFNRINLFRYVGPAPGRLPR